MKVTMKKGHLVIDLPLEEPRASASGKTLVVASSRGVRTTSVKIGGDTVCVNVNAFVYPELETEPLTKNSGKKPQS